jgi:pentatricopeptide repeat protein
MRRSSRLHSFHSPTTMRSSSIRASRLLHSKRFIQQNQRRSLVPATLGEPFLPDYDTHGSVVGVRRMTSQTLPLTSRPHTYRSDTISFKRPRKDISRRSMFTESTSTSSSSACSYTPADANAEVVAMREAADKLLQTDTGLSDPKMSSSGSSLVPLTPEEWFDAEEVLKWWASQRTVESVQISMSLLEFLVREQEKAAGGDETDLEASAFLDRDLMNSIVLNWQQCWKTNHSALQKDWNPETLLQKLDHLTFQSASSSNPLQVSGKALSMLIDGTVRHSGWKSTSPSTAAFAEHLLDRMTDPEKGASGFVPSVSNLNAVLHAWAKSGKTGRGSNDNGNTDDMAAAKDAPARAEALLDRMSQFYVEPDIVSYNTVILAWSNAGQPQHAEALLEEMYHAWVEDSKEGRNSSDTTMIQPDRISFNTVISAWARSNEPNAAERAQSILKRMYDPQDMGTLQVTPNIITYNTMLDCWARSGHKDAAERCLAILQEMQELYEVGEMDARPDVISYTTVINAFAKSGKVAEAEGLLNEMHMAFMSGDNSLKPNVRTLTAIVEAWSRSDAVDSLERAVAVFQRIRELHEFGLSNEGPDVVAYNIMLNCYAVSARGAATTSNLREAAKRADSLLQEMNERSAKGERGATPDFRSYSIVIHAWAQALNDRRAVKLLHEALDAYEVGEREMELDLPTVHTVLRALGRGGKGAKAEKLLERLCTLRTKGEHGASPTAVTFSLVVTAWSKSAEIQAAQRAETVLKQMRRMYEAGAVAMKPDFLIYSSLITCWAHSQLNGAPERALAILGEMRQRAKAGDSGMEPDVVSYNAVLQAFSQARNPERAEDLLNRMYYEYQKGNVNTKPDLWSFNTVLAAWARSNASDAVERSERLVSQMQRLDQTKELSVRPNVVTYNNLINCLANSRRSDAPERAETMLRWMTDQFRGGDTGMKPSRVSYGSVIKAWNSAGSPGRAEVVLRELHSQYMNGNADMKPDRHHYKNVADKWSKTAHPEAQERSSSILKMMNDTHPTSHRDQRANSDNLKAPRTTSFARV